jgi:hypothetical protein
MLVVVAVVVEVLVAGIIEMMVADYLDWRSEIFLEFFLIYKSILEDLFNPKYHSIASNIQFEIFNNSGVSASIFMIAKL